MWSCWRLTVAKLQGKLAHKRDKKLSDLVDVIVFPHVDADQGIHLALERMGANKNHILPVVSRADIHKREGVVTLGMAGAQLAQPTGLRLNRLRGRMSREPKLERSRGN